MTATGRSAALALPALLVGSLLVVVILGGAAHGMRPLPAAHPSSSVEFVNVSATSSFSFQPSQFYVTPGATVHIAVKQLANFAHTFTLSSVRNATIPTSDSPAQLYQYFQTNPPILNLSLPGTVGFVNASTFVAPAEGFYEFVCTEPTHFQSGMKGFMNSTNSLPSSSSSSVPLTTYLLIGIAVGVVVAIVAVVAVVRVRRRRATPPPPS
jgi:plastocyanin